MWSISSSLSFFLSSSISPFNVTLESFAVIAAVDLDESATSRFVEFFPQTVINLDVSPIVPSEQPERIPANDAIWLSWKMLRLALASSACYSLPFTFLALPFL